MSNSTVQRKPSQALIDQAISLYNQGRLQQTLSFTERLTKKYSNTIILYEILGATHLGLGNNEKTIEIYQKVLQHRPKHSEAYNNIGLALYNQGKLNEAAKSYQKAISIEPDFADAHYNLGNALLQAGELKKSIESYQASLAISPDDAEVSLYCGNALKSYGDFDKAIDLYTKALVINPNLTDAQINLNKMCQEKENINKLILDFAAVSNLQTDSAETINFKGTVLKAKGYLETAIENYGKAIQIKPKYAVAYNNMGNALVDKGELGAAINNYKKAINSKPDFAEAFNNMGIALKEKCDLNAAINSYKKAVEFKPDYAEAYYNLGHALSLNSSFEYALENCQQAIQINPNYDSAKYLKARLLLNCHEFELGWSLYHASRDPTAEDTLVVTKRAEMWKGSSLRGKNIQVYAAQGVGDEIGFSSCIPDLIELSPKTIYLECDPRLKPLFERSFPEIITYGKARTQWLAEHFTDSDIPNIDDHIDYSISIDGLPQFFRNHLEDFPKRNSFLLPDPKLVKKWSKRLKAIGDGLKVGISWKGGTGKAKNLSSIPLRFWQDLLSADAFFINLQYGETSDEVSKFSAENGIKIYDWEDNDASIDLDNQAALISELDLVISVDNATVHSCMALGTEIWDLMDSGRNLMWMDNGKNVSPLSPHLRLFKKKPLENWDKVFTQVEIELRARIAEQ